MELFSVCFSSLLSQQLTHLVPVIPVPTGCGPSVSEIEATCVVFFDEGSIESRGAARGGVTADVLRSVIDAKSVVRLVYRRADRPRR
jgi:hypothetical protein